MEGIISNFKMGRHHHSGNQMVLLVEGVDKKEKTSGLIGKTVVWKSPAGKEIKGKITMPHGRNGAVRVLFEKGMPGQAIGKKVLVE